MPSEYTCRTCGTPIPKTRAVRSGRCGPCYLRHCKKCDAVMPEGRKNARCIDCMRAVRERLIARSNRTCYDCGGAISPGSRVNGICSACRKEEGVLSRAHLSARPDRPCLGCGQPVGERRSTHRCRDCHRAYRERLYKQPGRKCSVCGKGIGHSPQTYCPPCRRMYLNWRGAVKRGDAAAARVRPLREYRKWSQP